MKLSKTEQALLNRMQTAADKRTCISWGCYYGPGKPRPYGRRECHAGQSLVKKGLAKFIRHNKSQYYKNGYGTHVYDTILEVKNV